jgi:hypothetical protein
MKKIIILTALILMQFLGRAQSSEEVVSFAKDLFPEGFENWDIIINPVGFSSIALKFVLVAGKKVVTRCKSVLVAGKGIFTRCKSVLVINERYSMNFMIINN